MSLPENRARQLKLREELHNAGIGPDSEVYLTEVQKLQYLYHVIRETLRRYPPIPTSLMRVVPRDQRVVIHGHAIPAGVSVLAKACTIC